MLSLKSITETLATLGGGAILLAGCGGAPEAAEVPAQPAAGTHEGAAGSCSAGSCGGSAKAEGDKPAEAATPTDAAQPTATETMASPTEKSSGDAAAGTGTGTKPATQPAGAAPAAPAAKPAAKKPGTTAGAPAKPGQKKGAQGSCGEGTCG